MSDQELSPQIGGQGTPSERNPDNTPLLRHKIDESMQGDAVKLTWWSLQEMIERMKRYARNHPYLFPPEKSDAEGFEFHGMDYRPPLDPPSTNPSDRP